MKLLNPTDQELDAAFAEYVAGWKPVCHCGDRMDKHRHDEHVPVQMDEPLPNFTRSFDAVLPFLDKHSPRRADCGGEHGYMLQVWRGLIGVETLYVTVTNKSLPRAAVIALLRAHGHEVEFTT